MFVLCELRKMVVDEVVMVVLEDVYSYFFEKLPIT